jgi:hypothetical protein
LGIGAILKIYVKMEMDVRRLRPLLEIPIIFSMIAWD